MSLLTILTDKEQREFDCPPQLSHEARVLCFAMPDELATTIRKLRTPTNQVGFLLQYGYFKACKRFFVSHRYQSADIDYVIKVLGYTRDDVDLSTYVMRTPQAHQQAILKRCHYQSFNDAEVQWVRLETARRIEQFTEPRELLFELLALLHSRCVEIPSYHRLSRLITDHYLALENQLLTVIHGTLTDEHRVLLKSLLAVDDKAGSKGMLNQLKHISQATSPKAIQASLNLFNPIRTLHSALLPVIQRLNLSPQACQYYATWVKKAKLSQIKQFADVNKTYLHLITFIQHQYCTRQDVLVDILLQCVQSAKNTTTRRLQETDKLSRSERRDAVQQITTSHGQYRTLIDAITDITRSPVLTDAGKISQINTLLRDHKNQQQAVEQDKMKRFE